MHEQSLQNNGNITCLATLLKSHFGMGVLLYICCVYSEHLFLRTPLDSCFWFCLEIWFVTWRNISFLKIYKEQPEALTQCYSIRKLFSKNSLNLQKNTWNGVLFLVQYFSYEFGELFFPEQLLYRITGDSCCWKLSKQTFTCSRSTIEYFEKMWNISKVNNKGSRMTSMT